MGRPLCPQCKSRVPYLRTDEDGPCIWVDATFCDFCDRIWAAGGGLEAYSSAKQAGRGD